MAAKESFTKTELRAGFMVLFAAVVALVFIAATTALRPTKPRTTLYAYFQDTVGLNKGADVRFGGVKVGRVDEIGPDPERQTIIRVKVGVDADTPVNAESRAFISQVTLTAQKHLAITTGEEGARKLEEDETIPLGGGDFMTAIASAGSKVTDLLTQVERLLGTKDDQGNELPAAEFGKVGELLLTLDEFFTDLRVLVGATEVEGVTPADPEAATIADILNDVKEASNDGKEAIATLRQFLEEKEPVLSDALDGAVEIEGKVSDLITDVDTLLTDNSDEITSAISSAESLLAQLDQTAQTLAPQLEELAGQLEKILTDVGDVSGQTVDLLEQNGPTIEEILYDVREMVRDLKSFADTIANEPNALIRGKGPAGRQ